LLDIRGTKVNVSGVGSDISRLMSSDSAAPSNRSNGNPFSPLESGKADFQNALTTNISKKPEAKESLKATKANYKKTGAHKSGLKDNLNPGTHSGVSPRTESRPETKGRETSVEKYDEIDSARTPIVTEESAMVTFLTAMQREIGVEPQKVVEAMVSLDAESMRKPPEETMTAILENLEIPADKMPKAEELYQKMLMETAEASMGKMLRENSQTIDFKVMGPEQVRMQNLIKSLDDLESSFFDTKKVAAPVAPLITNEQIALNAMNTTASEQAVSGLQPAAVSGGSTEAMTIEDLMAQLAFRPVRSPRRP
jgi:hypothetical protein